MSISTLPPSKTIQAIEFPVNGEDGTVAIFAENVTLISSPGDHTDGSSKVKLNNITDYSWEEKYYHGQLLAVHMGGNYIAYSIKGANYAVRVVNRETAKRALIKGFGAMVEDLSFAFIPNQITLASVDETGGVYIHSIFEDNREIATNLVLHILETEDIAVPRKVFWCPYIPDEQDILEQDPYSDETSLLLAVTRDSRLDIWNVANASSNGSGPVKAELCSSSCVQISAHESTIVDAAFSPDGTAIATASMDGECKFFQVYMQSEGEPTCLHRWKPHGGKPVTSLFFLDDHKSGNPDIKFWKYAVTGTDDNSELKLWTCETWKCLQTIKFSSKSSKKHSKLKASVDLSAGYILVSDQFSKILFVLELEKNNNETIPFVRTVTEFKLPCPILSFSIVDAGPTNIKTNSSFGVEDISNGDDEEQSAVTVRMFLVQPKSLQECHIVFQTDSPIIMDNIYEETKSLFEESENEMKDQITLMETPHSQQPTSINLMTPDAFNHSPHTADSTPVMSRNSGTPVIDPPLSYSTNMGLITNGEPVSDSGGGDRRRGFISGGSSPSREVEEILSSPRYYVEDVPQPQKSQPQPSKSVEVYEKLEGLESTVQSLQSDVSSLCHAVKMQSTDIQNLQELINTNRTSSTSDLERVVTKAVLTYRPVSEEELVRDITPLISQAVLTTINPGIVKSMSELHDMVFQEVSQKLNTTEQHLKDNMTKISRSKPFTEMMTKTLTNTATSAMESVFKESFMKTAIPMFEGACRNMFVQLSEAFKNGLNESIKDMHNFTSKLQERANMEVLALQAATERMTQIAQHLTSTVEKESKGMEDTVLEVEKRLKACMNGAAVRSGTATPAQHLVDPHIVQSQVTLLIKQGQYNTAFQQALSAADLSIVSYVCEKVDVSKVFTKGGCVLQQHVLLSLIQQLAADMSSHTDTKQKYLDEAVMNLLTNNDNTREHMPQVLTGLQKQLQIFTSMTNDPRLGNKAKMLAMACQQIIRNLNEKF